MRAYRLHNPADVEREPLKAEQVARPEPGPDELLLQVRACGVCHTDLHTVEGDIAPPAYPITPGHQVVAEVAQVGAHVSSWEPGQRVGVPWLHSACGECDFCKRGEDNLCSSANFTGFHIDGGYAEYMLAEADYALPLPEALSDVEVAPLLCAGIIGYRSLRKAQVEQGDTLGLVGFGASAHLAIQVANHWDCSVYVFTRSESHRRLARVLGAAWVGGSEDEAPRLLDKAVIFAPAGELVPAILRKLRPGGTLAINAIYMSPIPQMPYEVIYEERTLRSVANATYQDGVDFLRLAAEIPVQTTTQRYDLDQANEALLDLKHSRIDGAGVLLP
jgi:propanol-preferring alcohol dehydrogenase